MTAFLAGEGRGATIRGAYAPPGTDSGAGWAWLPDSAIESPTGLFLIELDARRIALVPPFAPLPPFEPWQDCLKQALDQRHLLGVILLRLGHYAVGVVDNDGVVASKAGSRYVHGRHRAGGQSQRRWERNRDQWIEKLFDRVCLTWTEVCGDLSNSMDHIALGGDRVVLARFLKQCPSVGRLRDRELARRVPVERPGSSSVDQARMSIWSSVVYEIST